MDFELKKMFTEVKNCNSIEKLHSLREVYSLELRDSSDLADIFDIREEELLTMYMRGFYNVG